MAYKPKMNSKRTQLLQSFQEQLQRGDQLDPAAYKNYKRLVGLQNKDQYQADLAAQKQQAANYQQALDTAPQRALGGYLGPQGNYNFDQYAQDAGLGAGATQAQFLRGLTPQDYGTGTGRPDWNMGQALSAPNNQDFQNQFGYDISNSLKPFSGKSAYTPEDFKKDFGQDLKDVSTLSGVPEFQKYSGNTAWSLADQLKQFTGKDLENSPGYQFGLKQGQQALDRTAAARGGALGGGQLKAQTQYAQDYAGTKFNDAFNQDMATKQANLNQFNNFVGNDMNRKSNLLNMYQVQQGHQLSQYNSLAGQDLANRQNAQGFYNNWYDSEVKNQNRDLQNFYNLANYKNTIGNNVLNNYQQNWNNYENQRNTYGNYLMNLAQMGQNAAGGTAGMLTGQNNAMADRFTGAASANAQNNWNGAMATNQAIQGGLNNGMQIAGMYNSMNGGGKNWFSTKPMQSYGDINGPGMSTVIA